MYYQEWTSICSKCTPVFLERGVEVLDHPVLCCQCFEYFSSYLIFFIIIWHIVQHKKICVDWYPCLVQLEDCIFAGGRFWFTVSNNFGRKNNPPLQFSSTSGTLTCKEVNNTEKKSLLLANMVHKVFID